MQHVLIIEDDPPLASFYTRILQFNGYEPIWAASCQEALNLLNALCPDVILLDVILPDGNGLEFLDQTNVLAICDPLKVVVISSGDFKAEVRARGISHFTNKPVSAEMLLSLVKGALAS